MKGSFRSILTALLVVALGVLLTSASASDKDSSDKDKNAKTADLSAVTFTKDIAPILYSKCAECHRPGEAAPFSVLSYKEVRPWARSIKDKVVSHEMPPWHADPHFGQWSNDRRLSNDQYKKGDLGTLAYVSCLHSVVMTTFPRGCPSIRYLTASATSANG